MAQDSLSGDEPGQLVALVLIIAVVGLIVMWSLLSLPDPITMIESILDDLGV